MASPNIDEETRRHQETYEGFVAFTTWSVIFLAVLLAVMAATLV
ncbi:MAG: hypothetical protein OHK0024_23890 [Thalassobaculales bacterium]